jgi:heat shock protein HslJ
MLIQLTKAPRTAASLLVGVILALLCGCAAPPPPEVKLPRVPLLLTHWHLMTIKAKPIVLGQGQQAPYIRLLGEHKLEGFGGCNRLTGEYETQMAWLRFNSIGTTRMACAGVVATQESAFLAALERGAIYVITRNQLQVLDYQHKVILTFAPNAPPLAD